MGCLSSSPKVVEAPAPEQFDPLGAYSIETDPVTGKQKRTYAATGGPQAREEIFSQLDALAPATRGAAAQAAGAATRAAYDPRIAQAGQLATDTISGKYLGGGPQMLDALRTYRGGTDKLASDIRSATAASTADQAANQRSQLARAGLGFSTANQQASDASAAAGTARANELVSNLINQANQYEAGAKIDNYGKERNLQTLAPSQLYQSLQTPVELLSSIPNMLLSPEAQAGQIVSGLAGGGPTTAQASPTLLQKPSALDQIAPILGIAGAAAGM